MVFFWPLAIGAVLASARASRALGAGDVAAAAAQARHVRALGVAALVVGVATRVVGVALLVGAVGLAERAAPALGALADTLLAPTASAAPLVVPPAAPDDVPDLGPDVSFAAAKPWRLLAPGDCFGSPELRDVVLLVPCERTDVFTVFYAGAAGPTWPGSEVGEQAAAQVCDAALDDLGRRPEDVPYWTWFTVEDDWQFWPRLLCVALPASGAPEPAPAPSPTDTRAPADGGPRNLSIALAPSCFAAEPLVARGDLVVELKDFCDEAHTGQVFANGRIRLEDAESDATIWAAGRDICADAWTEFVGGGYTGPPLEIWAVVPEFSEWEEGSRGVTCAVTSAGFLVGSLAGSAG